MNMVSNFIGSISPEMFGKGVQNATHQGDLNDTTFSDMLEKQIEKEMQQNKIDLRNSFGTQAGIDIGDFAGSAPKIGTDFQIKSADKTENINQVNEFEKSAYRDMSDIKNMSTPEVVTFFSSLFDSKPTMADTKSSGLFDFERKMAAGMYNKYAKNIVTDLNEFVSDTMRMKY